MALSLGSPPAGVTRRPITVEPGLSSGAPKDVPRSPGHLARRSSSSVPRLEQWGNDQGQPTKDGDTAADRRQDTQCQDAGRDMQQNFKGE